MNMKPSFFGRFFNAVSLVKKASSSVLRRARHLSNSFFKLDLKLLNAIYKGASIDYIKFLIWAGADVNHMAVMPYADDSKHYRKISPLMMHAIDLGQIEIVKFLLQQPGIEVNKTDIHGETALIKAAWSNQAEIVRLLLQHEDIDVNKAEPYGRTPLQWAVTRVNHDLIFVLLQHKGIDVTKAKIDNEHMLIGAIQYGLTEMVKALLKRKDINVDNIKANNGDSSLTLAAAYGRTEITQALLAWEKAPDLILKDKKEALSRVCQFEWSRPKPSKKLIISELIINAMGIEELIALKEDNKALSEEVAKSVTNKIDEIVNLDIAPSLKAPLGKDLTSLVLDYFLPHAASKKTKKEAQSEENQPEEAEPVIPPRP